MSFRIVSRFVLASLILLVLSSAEIPAPAQENVAGNLQAPVIRLVRNPDAAPAIDLQGLDGKPINLKEEKGKVVLLNFWATWCGPCRDEVPDLIELQNRYKDKLQIIALTVDDDDADEVRKFVEQAGINFRIGMSTPRIRGAYGGIPALPSTFVIDQQGRVVQKHVGLNDPALFDLEIRAILGLPSNARVEKFDDAGEIFLAHADRATELPGVDLSRLTPDQRTAALHEFNAHSCTCGCSLTLAQCRIYDSECHVSQEATQKVVAKIAAGSATDTPSPAQGAPSTSQK